MCNYLRLPDLKLSLLTPSRHTAEILETAIMDDQEKSKAFANAFDAEVDVRKTGNLAFVEQQGGNESAPMYQEASGAPVETRSPLGYDVKWFTIIFLNIGQMIGTGVFSTRTPSPCGVTSRADFVRQPRRSCPARDPSGSR